MISQILPQILPFFVISPVLVAVFIYVFASLRYARLIAIIVQGAFVVPALLLLLNAGEADIYVSIGDYEGFLGIILRADSLAAVFVFLTVIIFLAVGIFTIRNAYDGTSRLFLFLIFLLEGALIGLFLTRDFFNTFVLVEVSTVIVTILLMYDRERRNLFAGMTFIMVNIIVMQFYLFGLGYIYMITGVMDMEAAAAVIANKSQSELALPYALIMTSIASKCSLLPMLTWLPKVNSLSGSRSTIAAIMSGLHIKSGVYLFIRFQDAFGGIASEFFLVAGLVTAFAGVILALAQTDIRLILAYSTIAQVGLIIVGLNLSTDYSHIGSVFHIVNHSLFKVALFLCSGQIYYLFNTYDVRKIRGLFRGNPLIACATILAVLGIIGAPFFNGSISKYLLMHGTSGVIEWLIILINFGTILIFVRFSAIFFGQPVDMLRKTTPDYYRLTVLFGLGLSCLALGLFGTQAVEFLFNEQVRLDFWGYIEKIVIFAFSMGLGVIIYKYALSNKDFLSPFNNFILSFQKICVSIGIFFALILVYVGLL